MRLASPYAAAALLPLLALAVPSACSSGSPATDAGTDAQGGDASPLSFTYTGEGCAFTTELPELRGFTEARPDADEPITTPADGMPLRVRLGSVGGLDATKPGYPDPSTRVAITWQTAKPVSAAKVRFGKAPGALSTVRRGFAWTTPAPTVGLGTTEPPVHMHEVHVCGLEPGTTYYYEVGGGAPGAEVWSETHSFTTVPQAGPVTLGYSGDSRDSMDVLRLVQTRMRDAAVSMQLYGGDLVMFGQQASLFDAALDAMAKDGSGKLLTLGEQIMALAPGNHEGSSAQFYGSFALPGEGAYAETYGSFDVQGMHVVVLDDQPLATAPMGPVGTAELEWLKSDLGRASQDRAKHPFLVVVHHRGIFSTSSHGTDTDVLALRRLLVPVYDAAGVDLVLNGHDHEFERTKPLRGPADAPVVQPSTQTGTTYVISAGAGAHGYGAGGGTFDYRAVAAEFDGQTGWVGVYTLLRLDARTLKVSTYGLKASATGVAGDDVLDEITLSR